MNNKTIQVDIVSPEKQLFSDEALSVVAPALLGEVGIYPRHTPLFTQLQPGTVRIQLASGKEKLFYVASGFLEVQPYCVTILADTAERAKDLDREKAEKAKERSERLLAKGDFEHGRAAAELAQAVAQLRAIKQLRKGKR